ncbi:hypothetical protein HCN44_009190 [Aphidius gifuensis]|uniref:Moesin/ezrin/radixin homolog 1 n=1 Tax=Aphidius gifuensis TaxID=684658 RepID=A0A834Y6V1_APHGI|nr:tyrosine-protein phosphatase non-receptor type 14-like [Aphidius gifuensis]KAF7997792.1 hypothetical protein HCN44_009190 [Aphidius gifuensis]
MPFKFHLKKSRQYNVVSKNQYVICVELLDQTSIECTLSVESLGKECLDSVIQRLGLDQPEFFGLQYVCRHGENIVRWVDFEKPLKRQLEKEAKSFHLYLRVMFYITDVQLIHEEMTRYHYYLQLKSDVLEGKTQCNDRQAARLAAYSMQAEFGNFDPVKHTLETLQQYILFPKDVIEIEPGSKSNLLHSAIYQYRTLQGVTQTAAEELYITVGMQLEGYGYETFNAKDYSGNEVVLGISINGIMVVSSTEQPTQFYTWTDIRNVTHDKKKFKIKCSSVNDETKRFIFDESKNATYMWRLCIAQHTFYMQFQDTSLCERLTTYFDSDTNDSSEPTTSVNLENRNQDCNWTSCNDLSSSPYPPATTLSAAEMENLRALLPSYRPAPDYETAVQMKYNECINEEPQPYYANQSTIEDAELNGLLGNATNQNRY